MGSWMHVCPCMWCVCLLAWACVCKHVSVCLRMLLWPWEPRVSHVWACAYEGVLLHTHTHMCCVCHVWACAYEGVLLCAHAHTHVLR